MFTWPVHVGRLLHSNSQNNTQKVTRNNHSAGRAFWLWEAEAVRSAASCVCPAHVRGAVARHPRRVLRTTALWAIHASRRIAALAPHFAQLLCGVPCAGRLPCRSPCSSTQAPSTLLQVSTAHMSSNTARAPHLQGALSDTKVWQAAEWRGRCMLAAWPLRLKMVWPLSEVARPGGGDCRRRDGRSHDHRAVLPTVPIAFIRAVQHS